MCCPQGRAPVWPCGVVDPAATMTRNVLPAGLALSKGQQPPHTSLTPHVNAHVPFPACPLPTARAPLHIRCFCMYALCATQKCGTLVCGNCSANKMYLDISRSGGPSRVCTNCYRAMTAEEAGEGPTSPAPPAEGGAGQFLGVAHLCSIVDCGEGVVWGLQCCLFVVLVWCADRLCSRVHVCVCVCDS